MRKALDRLYGAAMVGACVAMVMIAVLVLIQVLGRILDRAATMVGMVPPGITVPSLAEIGGFLFVAATFLALPYTLRAGGHVRVTLLLNAGPAWFGRALTLAALAAAVGLAGFAAWHSILQALDSHQFNSLSFGIVRVPLWIPQGVMSLGLGLFFVALVDELIAALRGQDPAFRHAEKNRQDGGH